MAEKRIDKGEKIPDASANPLANGKRELLGASPGLVRMLEYRGLLVEGKSLGAAAEVAKNPYEELPHIAALFGEKNPKVRKEAAATMMWCAERGVDISRWAHGLMVLASDGNRNVALAAQAALEKAVERGMRYEGLCGDLGRMLESGDGEKAAFAAKTLSTLASGGVGISEFIPRLVFTAESNEGPARRFALEALESAQKDGQGREMTIQILERLLNSQDAEIRAHAVAIAQAVLKNEEGGEGWGAKFERMLQDPSPHARARAAAFACELAKKGGACRGDAIGGLRRLLADGDELVAGSARAALERVGEAPAAERGVQKKKARGKEKEDGREELSEADSIAWFRDAIVQGKIREIEKNIREFGGNVAFLGKLLLDEEQGIRVGAARALELAAYNYNADISAAMHYMGAMVRNSKEESEEHRLGLAAIAAAVKGRRPGNWEEIMKEMGNGIVASSIAKELVMAARGEGEEKDDEAKAVADFLMRAARAKDVKVLVALKDAVMDAVSSAEFRYQAGAQDYGWRTEQFAAIIMEIGKTKAGLGENDGG